jgi:DNA-binding NarL/FixJ family response regulator
VPTGKECAVISLPPEVSPPLVHIAVVDDNTLYREWLGHGTTLALHHHVVARAATAEGLAAVLDHLPDQRCDLILLDLRIIPDAEPDPAHGGPAPAPVVEGRDAVALLLTACEDAVRRGTLAAQPAVLVHTQEAAPRVHVACLLAGACGVVRKGEPMERLRDAVDIAAAGGLVIGEQVAGLLEILADQQRLDLTDTEASVLALIAHGWTRRRIARELDSTESTVDKHLRAMRSKFGDGVNLVDLADAFGLRDLAPPRPTVPSTYRQRLRALLHGSGRR